MRLVEIACAAAAAAALLPAAAEAKELAAARACDASDCRTIADRAALDGMIDGAPVAAPHAAAPFYRVRMTIAHGGEEVFRYTLAYVPSAGLLRSARDTGGYDWMTPTPRGRRGFDRLVAGLEPLPAEHLRGLAPAPLGSAAPAPGADGDGGPPSLLLPLGALALVLAAAALGLRRAAARSWGRRAAPGQDGPPPAPTTAP